MQRLVADMLSAAPSTCRQLAEDLAISAMTAWLWRQKVNRALSALASMGSDKDATDDVAWTAGPAIVLRESRKASREWVNHARMPRRHPAPDRLRWIDYRLTLVPLPTPMTPHLEPIAVAEDGRGAVRIELWPTGSLPAMPGRASRPDDNARPDSTVHGSARLSSSSAGWCAVPPCHGKATAEGQTGLLRRFLQRFRGPASRHLSGYLAWHLARLLTPDEASRRRLLSRLCGQPAR